MNNHPYLALESMRSNKIIQLPYNCQVLLQKDLDITVKINSAYQTHPITFSCLLPKGTNQKRIRVLFTSRDDLFFLYALDIDQQVIFGLNNDFSLKLKNLNQFLQMFAQILQQIQNNIKKACLSYSNQNTLTLQIKSIINGKQFLILRLIAEKQPNDVVQAWTAFKYGELKESIGKRQNKIVQLKELVRVKNPYLLHYIGKIQ